jgi:predicted DNA-binding transcriptional regulator AlpA
MPSSLYRFPDLQERRIAGSWAQLGRMQKQHGFPAGIMLSENVRAWYADQVDAWLANRPTANATPLKGAARVLHERRGAKADDQVA